MRFSTVIALIVALVVMPWLSEECGVRGVQRVQRVERFPDSPDSLDSMDSIDFSEVSVYRPAAYVLAERRLVERGMPREFVLELLGSLPPAIVDDLATKDIKNVQSPFASAARTVTANSDWFNVGEAKTIINYLSVTAASGTTPTLDVTVQDAPDGGTTAFSLVTFTQATAATTEVKVPTRGFGRHVRHRAVIGGTTPSFTFASWLIAY